MRSHQRIQEEVEEEKWEERMGIGRGKGEVDHVAVSLS